MTTLKYFTWSLSLLFLFSACGEDEEPIPTPDTKANFTVTIENVFAGKSYQASGALPTGLMMPGTEESISFDAGKGSYLSFATMFVQSNDLFYAFDETGFALYDADGNANTGDITGSVDLWDAGTEVNQEPGVGADQAPRQAAGNTGADENGTVQLIANVADGFTYPSDESVIELTLSHDGGTRFTLTLKNISGSATLPSPFAPGAWAVHGGEVQLFTTGEAAPTGLEGVAEDGANTVLVEALAAGTGYVSPYAPGVYAVHDNATQPLFTNGAADRGDGLEALAEDGDPAPLDAALDATTGVSVHGIFNTPTGASVPGPIFPGDTYSFSFDATDGDYLSLATMLIHTNDLFYAFGENGIALFENGTPRSGDLTSLLDLWDSGTEVNEVPGAGNNQPVRGGGDSGPAENGNVIIVNDGFAYPATADAIKVTITVN